MSGVPFEDLKQLIQGAVRQFMLATFHRKPYSNKAGATPSLGDFPTELHLPFLVGRPCKGGSDAAGTS